MDRFRLSQSPQRALRKIAFAGRESTRPAKKFALEKRGIKISCPSSWLILRSGKSFALAALSARAKDETLCVLCGLERSGREINRAV